MGRGAPTMSLLMLQHHSTGHGVSPRMACKLQRGLDRHGDGVQETPAREADLCRLKLMLRGFMLTVFTRCPALQPLLEAVCCRNVPSHASIAIQKDREYTKVLGYLATCRTCGQPACPEHPTLHQQGDPVRAVRGGVQGSKTA